MNASARDQLLAHLAVDEGFVSHAYQDHLGYWTIGYGRLIDKRRGGGITHDEARYLLGNDVDRFERAVLVHFPWVEMLADVRQVALFNLAFNLGIEGLSKFVTTLRAIQEGDWGVAAAGLRRSLWYQQVQRSRSERIIAMIQTGEWPHA
jgi:lysozyme